MHLNTGSLYRLCVGVFLGQCTNALVSYLHGHPHLAAAVVSKEKQSDTPRKCDSRAGLLITWVIIDYQLKRKLH